MKIPLLANRTENQIRAALQRSNQRILADGGVLIAPDSEVINAIRRNWSLFSAASLLCYPQAIRGGKLYSQTPADGSGDFTAVRGGVKNVLRADSGYTQIAAAVPPVSFDPIQGRHILKNEVQQTNLILNSNDFPAFTTQWENVTPASVSFYGLSFTRGICKLTGNAIKLQTVGVVSGFYQISVFCKCIDGDTNPALALGLIQGANQCIYRIYKDGSNFALIAGGNAQYISHKAEHIGMDFYRLSLLINLPSSGSANAYIGYGDRADQSWLLSEWNVTAGKDLGTPIQTTGATVTRPIDEIKNLAATGLINAAAGTVYFEFVFDFDMPLTDRWPFYIIDSLAGNVIYFFILGGSNNLLYAQMQSGSVLQVSINTAITPGTLYKCAFSWTLNNCTFFLNGQIVGSDTSCTMPVFSTAYMYNGCGGADNVPMNLSAVWKSKLTDADCIKLTTK